MCLAIACATHLYALFVVHCTIGKLDCDSFAEDWPELQSALQCKSNTSGVPAQGAADLCLHRCLQVALELHQVCPSLVSGICLSGLDAAPSLTSVGPQGPGTAALLVCRCWNIMLAALQSSNRGPTDLPMQATHAARALSVAGWFAASGPFQELGCLY